MPLSKGKTRESVRKNIKTLVREGKPIKQSIAIALDLQRRAKMRYNRAKTKS